MTYCVKQKKFTECIEPSGYKKSKNDKLMFYCKCKECGIMKYKFVKNQSGGSSQRLLPPAHSAGGSFDEAIVKTMGKVGLSKAIKSNTVS